MLWGVLLATWLLFTWWYTNTGGPLTAAEIDSYISRMEQRGRSPEQLEAVRQFLEGDTGDDFVMLNVIDLNETVPVLPGLPAGSDASDALNKYMEHMYPALFARACHPVAFGTAATAALDIWGIDNAADWSQGALMRYRSRRDMMEISSNPDFAGPHEFKVVAMNKTIAFPLDPWMSLGDPRLVLGMFLLILALVFGRRR